MSTTRQQALDCLQSDDLVGLGIEADALRQKFHPEGVVTYSLDRVIAYTRDLNDDCGFGFYLPLSHRLGAAGADANMIYDQIAETLEWGGTGVFIQGSGGSGLKIEWFEQLLQRIKERFPEIWLHSFSAPEISAIAKSSGLTVRDTLARLRDAGLGSIAGDGAAILEDEIRRHFPGLGSAEDWLNVHRTAHALGMRTTAGMTFGIGESFEQQVDHLEQILRLQQETGGFVAFLPWSARPSVAANGSRSDEPTAVDYLKMLAVSRLYLDNIESVQSNWAIQGLKVLEMALRFGADDAGSVLLEESLGERPGIPGSPNEERLRQVIRDAGLKPVQRDARYATCLLF